MAWGRASATASTATRHPVEPHRRVPPPAGPHAAPPTRASPARRTRSAPGAAALQPAGSRPPPAGPAAARAGIRATRSSWRSAPCSRPGAELDLDLAPSPSRSTSSRPSRRARARRSRCDRSSGEPTGPPATPTITSPPGRRPARSAGPPLETPSTAAPPEPSALVTPIQPRSIVCAAREARDHLAHGVGRDREAHAHVPARAGGGDLRVHPDHPPAGVHQRAAGVPGVDRGVGLDHLVDLEAVRRLDLASEAGDDSLGGRAVEAERVAHRHDGVADLHRRRSPPSASGAGFPACVRVDAERGQVGGGVAAEHLGGDAVAVLAEADGGAARPSPPRARWSRSCRRGRRGSRCRTALPACTDTTPDSTLA